MTTPTCAVDGCDYPAPNHRICVVCQSKLTRDLAELPAVIEDLEITLTRQAVLGRLAGGEQPLAFDPRASEVAWVLKNTLVRCARDIHDDAETWPADTSTAIAIWLFARRYRLLDHLAAEEACGEIGFIVREARYIIDRSDNRTTFHVGPCPEFDEYGVQCPGEIRAYIPTEEDKPARIQCEACGMSWGTHLWMLAGRRILEATERLAG